MKTFVRRASSAELSADFTKKETNERAHRASLFPFTRQFSYRVCEYSLRKGKREETDRQRERERENERERVWNFSGNMMRARQAYKRSEWNSSGRIIVIVALRKATFNSAYGRTVVSRNLSRFMPDARSVESYCET